VIGITFGITVGDGEGKCVGGGGGVAGSGWRIRNTANPIAVKRTNTPAIDTYFFIFVSLDGTNQSRQCASPSKPLTLWKAIKVTSAPDALELLLR
jgi:hypothetical protein